MDYAEIAKKEAELKQLKDRAVKDLLSKRAQLDDQLAQFGYEERDKTRRKRRTKAEMEILRAEEAAKKK